MYHFPIKINKWPSREDGWPDYTECQRGEFRIPVVWHNEEGEQGCWTFSVWEEDGQAVGEFLKDEPTENVEPGDRLESQYNRKDQVWFAVLEKP